MRATSLTAGPITVKSSRSTAPTLPYCTSPRCSARSTATVGLLALRRAAFSRSMARIASAAASSARRHVLSRVASSNGKIASMPSPMNLSTCPPHGRNGAASASKTQYEQELEASPFGHLRRQANEQGDVRGLLLHLRRQLVGSEAQLDFPPLKDLAAAGATDYFAVLVLFGEGKDASRGNGIGYSFATDRPEGFYDDDLVLLKAVLPAVSLAIASDAGHRIAAGLLAAYLGEDVGRRVHAGAVERGSVEGIRSLLWYADIRGFTAIADGTPGAEVISQRDEVFEALAAPLRPCGGQVLKFIGDGMLAIFPFDDAARDRTCRRALDAAAEAMRAIDRLNAARRKASKPTVAVDLALHLGEVQYGNVGAVDRLDFTVIGPAVNEVARIGFVRAARLPSAGLCRARRSGWR